MIGIMVSEVDGTTSAWNNSSYAMLCSSLRVFGQKIYISLDFRSGYEIQNDRWVVPPEHDRVP
jgi:hypothetical protein